MTIVSWKRFYHFAILVFLLSCFHNNNFTTSATRSSRSQRQYDSSTQQHSLFYPSASTLIIPDFTFFMMINQTALEINDPEVLHFRTKLTESLKRHLKRYYENPRNKIKEFKYIKDLTLISYALRHTDADTFYEQQLQQQDVQEDEQSISYIYYNNNTIISESSSSNSNSHWNDKKNMMFIEAMFTNNTVEVLLTTNSIQEFDAAALTYDALRSTKYYNRLLNSFQYDSILNCIERFEVSFFIDDLWDDTNSTKISTSTSTFLNTPSNKDDDESSSSNGDTTIMDILIDTMDNAIGGNTNNDNGKTGMNATIILVLVVCILILVMSMLLLTCMAFKHYRNKGKMDAFCNRRNNRINSGETEGDISWEQHYYGDEEGAIIEMDEDDIDEFDEIFYDDGNDDVLQSMHSSPNKRKRKRKLYNHNRLLDIGLVCHKNNSPGEKLKPISEEEQHGILKEVEENLESFQYMTEEDNDTADGVVINEEVYHNTNTDDSSNNNNASLSSSNRLVVVADPTPSTTAKVIRKRIVAATAVTRTKIAPIIEEEDEEEEDDTTTVASHKTNNSSSVIIPTPSPLPEERNESPSITPSSPPECRIII